MPKKLNLAAGLIGHNIIMILNAGFNNSTHSSAKVVNSLDFFCCSMHVVEKISALAECFQAEKFISR